MSLREGGPIDLGLEEKGGGAFFADVDVTVETGTVVVTSAAPLERAAVDAAVAEAGYTLV